MIIDIYKFIINNYSSAMKNPTKFNEIQNTSNINNSIINAASDDNEDNNNDIYSIDYIRSNPIKNKYYHLYLNKNAKVDRVDYKFTTEYLNDFCKNITKAYNKTKKHYNKLLLNDLLKKDLINDKLKLNNSKPFDLNTDGYIKKVYVNNNEKIIIFGDYHGSFHTFFRNLLRLHVMGVVNLNTFKINDNYKIIFLGDIIDRGQYSLEILDILFQFIINNKSNKLLINKGNHEDLLQNTVDGFLKEIKSKVHRNISKLLHININKIFNYLPTAIILINKDNNKKYWLCHGFVPQDYDFLNKVKKFVDINNNDNLLLMNNYYSFQIKWNDTSTNNESTHNSKRTTELNTIFNVGLDITKKYLETFDFIIRGHEDSVSNAWLLKTSTDKFFILSSDYLNQKTNQFELHKSNNKLINKNDEIITTHNIDDNNFVNGPVQTIYSNNLQNNILNVLTISTNTDYSRNLTSDSFVVLRFNENILPKVMDNNISIDKWLNKLDNNTIFKDDNYNKSLINKFYIFIKKMFL
jgi:hypothetical protein